MMRFRCPSVWSIWDWAKRRAQAAERWHMWFAWRPVTTLCGTCVWLEGVERRYEWRSSCLTGADYVAVYRLPEPDAEPSKTGLF